MTKNRTDSVVKDASLFQLMRKTLALIDVGKKSFRTIAEVLFEPRTLETSTQFSNQLVTNSIAISFDT